MTDQSTRDESRVWRIFFWLAAAYNIGIGGIGLFDPEALSTAMIVSQLVICFGIVYAILATDPLRYAAMLWAGIVGKVGVIAILAPEVQAGITPAGTGIILLGDGLFVIGFLLFLFRHRGVAL